MDIDVLINQRIAESDAIKGKRDAEDLAWRVKQLAKKRAEEVEELKIYQQKILWIVIKLAEHKDEEERFKKRIVESPEFKYIEQFIKIYGKKAGKSDILKLQLLLKNRNWELQLEQLELLINEVADKQYYETAKSKILRNNPESKREIISAYLDNYRSSDDLMLGILTKVLREKGLSVESIPQLKKEVIKIEEEIEADEFENFLLIKSEQSLFEDIDTLSGSEFEKFLKELFTKMGYQVEQTRLTGDQGADLVVVKFGEKTVIQAKRFAGKVGNYAVQEIMAAISFYRAQKGMVITNNYFTAAAVNLANANNIELVDRDALEKLINRYW